MLQKAGQERWLVPVKIHMVRACSDSQEGIQRPPGHINVNMEGKFHRAKGKGERQMLSWEQCGNTDCPHL